MANFQIIRDLCEKKKLTIRELASKIERNESTIQSMIRNGSTNTGTIELIAKVLEVSPAVFFDGFAEENEVISLRKEIQHLEALLTEKERTIAILMSDRKATSATKQTQ